jgi:SHS2 domain-containing protein
LGQFGVQEADLGGFTLVEHTADVGVSATGDSLEEALAWLAKGMFSLIVDPDTVAPSLVRRVSVSSRDRESLAVDWLNELIYQYEVTGFLVKDCRVTMPAEGDRLEARCRGEETDPARHQILTVVKAATYHNLLVSHNGQWRITVILDV